MAEFVPVYLVNAADDIVEKYKEANGAKAYIREGAMETWYNQEFPLRKVISVKADEVDRKAVVEDAYYNLFTKAMRIPVGPLATAPPSSMITSRPSWTSSPVLPASC